MVLFRGGSCLREVFSKNLDEKVFGDLVKEV
jgi:hypothetical protein